MADWNDFLERMRVYPKLLEDLNPPCSLNDIVTAEIYLGLTFPVNLKNIYLFNNGQRGEGKGLFKAVSGFDVYERLFLLSLNGLCSIWNTFSKDTDMAEYFIPTFIPFAADKTDYTRFLFCVDSNSEEVFLLWTAPSDFTLPKDWQLAKIKQTENLNQFLDYQILLYGH